MPNMDALGRRTRIDNSIGFAGVKRDGRRWRAGIRQGQKYLWGAAFDTPEEANAARVAKLAELGLIESLTPNAAKLPPPIPKCVWIPLTQGKFSLINETDVGIVSGFNWRFDTRGYAITGDGVLMHRLLLQTQKEIDHVNRDGLDNRRQNLRPATRAENVRNRGRNRNNSSGYTGVVWSKAARKWIAQASIGGKGVYLGCYKSARKAALVRDEWIRKHHGKFASLNFHKRQ